MVLPKKEIKCSQYFCEEQVLNLCCKSCIMQNICENRCMNSPDKCGLVSKKGLRKSLSDYTRIPFNET